MPPSSLCLLISLISASITATAGSPLGNTGTLHATRSVRTVGRGVQVESFHPKSTFETFGQGIDHTLQRRDNPNVTLEASSAAFVQQRLGVNASSISFRTGFSGETAKHAYFHQTHNGIPFVNAVANVAFNNDDKVVAFGSSFVKPTSIASSTPSIPLSAAISKAEESLSGTYNNYPTSLKYVVKNDGSAVLTHTMQIINESTVSFYEAFVDAHSGELVHLTDFKAPASYRVLPIQREILTQGFEILDDPQDLLASPKGWHTVGDTTYNETKGNNAMAYQTNGVTSITNTSSSGLNFIYVQNPDVSPTTATNVDAAATNAFYIVNTLHDTWYRYGFTEVSYNFQADNFGKGGLGNDNVTIAIQSNAGLDNADFLTPPEQVSSIHEVSIDPVSHYLSSGQSGQMHMYLWDYTTPERDGALENDIITHENTHGLTNRLVGGGTGACLQVAESGGLGEGWSDGMADWMEHNSSAIADFVMGQYVINFPRGIRGYPYSTNNKTNPLRYSSLTNNLDVHNIGEIWANMLHNVYAALVTAHGWSASARTNPSGNEGNVVFLHLFIDSLSLLPCNPTFLNTRDAWLQADVNRYGGANKCLLWQVFASRGMGINAVDHQDSAVVPEGC